jgi:hypothetical protein
MPVNLRWRTRQKPPTHRRRGLVRGQTSPQKAIQASDQINARTSAAAGEVIHEGRRALRNVFQPILPRVFDTAALVVWWTSQPWWAIILG